MRGSSSKYILRVVELPPGPCDRVSLEQQSASGGYPAGELQGRVVEYQQVDSDGQQLVVRALFGPDAVRDVVIGPDLPMAQRMLWIDTTTISPADATAFATWARQHDVEYVHAPVIGSLGPARARKLGVLIGGDPDAVAKAREVAVWADPARVKTDDTPAKAAVAKLMANLIGHGHAGGHRGAAPRTFQRSVHRRDSLDTRPHDARTTEKPQGRDDPAGSYDQTEFSADLLVKDIRLMMQSSRYPLPGLAAVFESLQTAVRGGRGDDDFSVIASPEAV